MTENQLVITYKPDFIEIKNNLESDIQILMISPKKYREPESLMLISKGGFLRIEGEINVNHYKLSDKYFRILEPKK